LILILAALALAALTVLAISLNEVPLKEGQRFSQPSEGTKIINPQELIKTWLEIPWWRQAALWVLIFLLVVLVGYLLPPELRKLLIRRFIRLAITFWAILYFFENYSHLIPALNIDPVELPSRESSSAQTVAAPLFVPSEISPTFSYLISFGVALLLLVIGWALYRGWQKYMALSNQKPLDEIARIARSSLKDLSSGMDSSDVIINCYLRMSDVVSNKRQLHRAIAMTPHEFALRLEQAGLPADAVKRLTRLFEAVRYGDRKSGPNDVKEAVGCLTTILHYCGEPV
jgi:hypothetical protein